MCYTHLSVDRRLLGPVVKKFASRAADLGSIPACAVDLFLRGSFFKRGSFFYVDPFYVDLFNVDLLTGSFYADLFNGDLLRGSF